jgi:hypothetical protein
MMQQCIRRSGCTSQLVCATEQRCLASPPAAEGADLIERLRGAQRMLDAGKPVSTWVTAQINNEAADALAERDRRIAQVEFNFQAMAQSVVNHRAHINALEAERDALRQDAERYRWLRQQTCCWPLAQECDGPIWRGGNTLDAAINAAIAGEK